METSPPLLQQSWPEGRSWSWAWAWRYQWILIETVTLTCGRPTSHQWPGFSPSQDPTVAMPVFKPAVRIGPTGQNVQMSMVGTEPRPP